MVWPHNIGDLVKLVSLGHQDDDFVKHILDAEQTSKKGVPASNILLLERLRQLALKVRLFEEYDKPLNGVDQSIDLWCVIVVLVKWYIANTVAHHGCLIEYNRPVI